MIMKEINPKIPRRLYKTASRSNQIQIWALGLGCFVTVFTFFMGIAYQYVFAGKNSNDVENNVHSIIVDTFIPNYQPHHDLLAKIIVSQGYKILGETELSLKVVQDEIINKWDETLRDVQNSFDIAERIKYYTSKKDFDLITQNSTLSYALRAISQSRNNNGSNLGVELYKFKVDNIAVENLDDEINRIMNQFKEEQQNINKDVNNALDGKNSFMVWDGVERALQNKIKNRELSDYEKNILFKARYNLLTELSCYIARNDSIIRANVYPIKAENITTQIKKINPLGVIRSILFLIVLLSLGLFVWRIVIMWIFRNSEIDNPLSENEHNKIQYLKAELAMVEAVIELYEKSTPASPQNQ